MSTSCSARCDRTSSFRDGPKDQARNPSGRMLCREMDSGLSPAGCPGMTAEQVSKGGGCGRRPFLLASCSRLPALWRSRAAAPSRLTASHGASLWCAWMSASFRLLRPHRGIKQDGFASPAKPVVLSEPPIKDPAPADDAAEGEPRPRRARKPVGWSMIMIGVLVAISATLVYRRDGMPGVLDILTHDLALFRSEERRVGKECRGRWWALRA